LATRCPAKDLVEPNDALPVFLALSQEFNSVQVDGAVTNDSVNPDRWAAITVDELNIDLSSDGQVGKSEPANATFADGGPASENRACTGQISGNDTGGHVNLTSLPSTLVSRRMPVQCHTRKT
jgi:hypothetical protein